MLRPRDGVAHAQPRQPRDLGEGPQRDQRGVAPLEHDAIRGVVVVAEIDVRLVQDHERRVRAEGVEEALERPAPDDGGRRVVRGADDHALRPRGDAAEHVVEVLVVALERARHDGGARENRLGAVGLESRVGDHDLVAGIERRARQHGQELVGPVADHDGFRRDAEPAPERLAHRRAPAVRVEMRAGGFPPDRLDDPGRRAQGVLVRGEPQDGVQPELARHHLERLAGVVRGDAIEHITPEPSHRAPL